MGRSILGWWRVDRDYFQAFRLWRLGKPAEAAKAFDRVLAAFPKHARAQAQRALALAAAGRVSDAVRAARRASELAPRNHAPLLFLGQIQYDAGQLEEARKAFSAAARLDPGNRLVQAYLGLAQLALGRAADGAELLKAHLRYANAGLEGRLLGLAERYLWEHRDRARSLDQQLTPEEGGRQTRPAGPGLRLLSALRKGALLPLALLRGRKKMLAVLAEEAISVNNYAQAIGHLKAAAQAGAGSEWVALSLASVYLQMDQPEAAVEQIAAVAAETPKDPGAAALAGEALFGAGRYAQARGPLELASRHFTREFAPPYYRGLCEIALGQPQAATRWFILACERLNPHIARKRLEEMMRVTEA